MRLLNFGYWGVYFFVFSLQKKEAERPKEEVIEKEEEIVHEDNDWGESLTGD